MELTYLATGWQAFGWLLGGGNLTVWDGMDGGYTLRTVLFDGWMMNDGWYGGDGGKAGGKAGGREIYHQIIQIIQIYNNI
jgi:hypothetical protein